jgi:hypothetical protein
MSITGSMHVEAHLLNNILELRSGESEVLKRTHDGPVERGIRRRRAIRGRKLGLRIDRRGDGAAVKHTGAIEELVSILLLMKKETIRSAHNLDAEEVV